MADDRPWIATSGTRSNPVAVSPERSPASRSAIGYANRQTVDLSESKTRQSALLQRQHQPLVAPTKVPAITSAFDLEIAAMATARNQNTCDPARRHLSERLARDLSTGDLFEIMFLRLTPLPQSRIEVFAKCGWQSGIYVLQKPVECDTERETACRRNQIRAPN
jgi:hypothetical protein